MKQVVFCVIVLASILAVAYCLPQGAAKKPAAKDVPQDQGIPGQEYFHQYKCYLKGVLEHLTILVDGKLSVANTKKLLAQKYEKEPDKLKKANLMVDECSKKVTGTPDPCETAYLLLKCFQIKNDEYGLEE
ncbi:general odorant-binding protein 72 [Anabrus simplex]|uniref:general odorant-binding protein 72 n=1 Tax=Anabrus simplex TaxID=316456 RepID=UPI0035A3B2AB